MLRQSLSGLRILVADDDYIVAHATCCQLAAAGAEICGPVPSVAEAVSMLSGACAPDAAVVKSHLRDGSAQPVVAMLAGHNVPVVVAVDLFQHARSHGLGREEVLMLPSFGNEAIDAVKRAIDAVRDEPPPDGGAQAASR